MSYRLIDSNDLALKLKYIEVNDMPCIFADLPNGLDGKHYTLESSRKGHWIATEYHRYRCPICREKGMSDWDNIHDKKTDFCPNCGACMKEGSEE